MKSPSLFTSILAIAWVCASCGTDPDSLVRKLDKGAVRLASTFKGTRVEVVENSYIVTFRDEGPPVSTGFASFLSEYRHHYSFLAGAFISDPRVKDIHYITSVDMVRPGREAGRLDLSPPPALQLAWEGGDGHLPRGIITRVDFANEDAAAAALTEWDGQGRLWFAEPNYENRLMGTFGDLAQAYGEQGLPWHTQIRLADAFSMLEGRDTSRFLSDEELGNNPPVIAVMDSGTDLTHPNLKDRIWVNPEPGASGCKDDKYGCNTTESGKGYIGKGDVTPYRVSPSGSCDPSFGTSGQDQEDILRNCPHGTHVAGIIAAEPGGGFGGICPVCRILTIKIIAKGSAGGVALDSAILNGLKYLALFKQNDRNLVRVVNSSFGKFTRSRAVALLVSVLKKSPNEVLVVGAAGNEDSMSRVYPAALSDAMAVSAVFPDTGNKASFSNFGIWVDVAAPGVGIVSTVPGGTSGEKSGTSMAAPMVSGLAGLMLSVNPDMGHNELYDRIYKTANGRALYQSEFNRKWYQFKLPGEGVAKSLLGAGLIDAVGAVGGQSAGPAFVEPEYRRRVETCGRVETHGEPSMVLLLVLLLAPVIVIGWGSAFSRKVGSP